MFTQAEIEAATAKVRTGADYPRLVQELKSLGVRRYEHMVTNGANLYHDDGAHSLRIAHPQDAISVAEVSSSEKLKHALSIHQRGETSYPTFCEQAGAAGVVKWVSDLEAMTVTYLDQKGTAILTEPIPAG